GRYILMPDPEDRPEDMDQVASMTKHVLGTHMQGDLDPANATAMGALRAIEVAVRHKLDRADLAGLRVSVMGLGPSGYRLAEHLRLHGAKVVVADRDPERTERAVRELGIACVATEEIVHLDADIFSPCVSKDVIDDDRIAHLRCSIIAGTGDDLLRSPAHGLELHERGILYAPDFITAAGGMISLVAPLDRADLDDRHLEGAIKAIGDRLQSVFDRAASENRATSAIADEQLQQHLAERAATPHAESFALTG
ncbi:MAG: Glu/Leu/Phe/Val dehydrogenase family protein, partial [Geminicoccaceae bacterium]